MIQLDSNRTSYSNKEDFLHHCGKVLVSRAARQKKERKKKNYRPLASTYLFFFFCDPPFSEHLFHQFSVDTYFSGHGFIKPNLLGTQYISWREGTCARESKQSSMDIIITGSVFGAGLVASGMYQPNLLTSQFTLTEWNMAQTFFTATGCGA